MGLNRFGHIQIFMVAIHAKLQRIFEMAIGYAVKHNRLPLEGLLFTRTDSVGAKEGVEVGAVDVDFATDLGGGNEAPVAPVAVALPYLWRKSKNLANHVGFYPFAVGVIGIASGYQADDLFQRIMEVLPFFFRDDKKKCRGAGVLEYVLHSSIKVRILSLKGWNRVDNSVV